MLSKVDSKEGSDSSSTSPTLLAWCSYKTNQVSIIDLETKQNYVTFDGARINYKSWSWTHVKEIPNSKLLVSLQYDQNESVNLELFDISKKGKAHKIYSLGESSGMVGRGDLTYNSRRSILAAIPVTQKIAYHLFTIDTSASNAGGIVKLNRKTRWSPGTHEGNFVTDLDFNPAGGSIATINTFGMCLISDVDTNNYVFHLQVGSKFDDCGRCRWSTNTGEPLLFVRYDDKILNILDVEKKSLILSDPIQLETRDYRDYTYWIDVCQSNGNLLASGGQDQIIKILDKRESKIVKTFGLHSDYILCVRWSLSGDMIASASRDGSVRLVDFKAGKFFYTGAISDINSAESVCFL